MIWNGADKRKIQNKAAWTKQIYILTIHTMKHLKHYYGSITVRENILCVCVCMCECVWLTQLKLQKRLSNKSDLCMLTTHF